MKLIQYLLWIINIIRVSPLHKNLNLNSKVNYIQKLLGSNNQPESLNQLLHNKLQKLIYRSAIAVPLFLNQIWSKVIADETLSPVSSSTKSASEKITSVAYIDVKIANYTEESIGKNRAAEGSGRIVVGLYGEDSPKSVERFLQTVESNGDLPTFINAQFNRIIDETLLQIDSIPGLEVVNVVGNEQYQYNGEVLTSYNPILESNQLRHNRRGLLTRRQLSSGPEFGITLKAAPELDGFHVVFGTILTGYEVLDAISKIPTYTYQTRTGYAGREKGIGSAVADKWFESQKQFYVGVGKALGDNRAVDRRGRLLRRIKIVKTGILNKSDYLKYFK